MIHSTASKADLPVIPPRGKDPIDHATRQSHAAEKHSDSESAQQGPQGPVDRVALNRAAVKFGEVLNTTDPRLKIEVDSETDQVVIKVVQQESGKIIRQIPPEDLLQLEKNLSNLKGLLVQKRA